MTDSTSTLAAVLTELGWKPEVLARRLNNFAALLTSELGRPPPLPT